MQTYYIISSIIRSIKCGKLIEKYCTSIKSYIKIVLTANFFKHVYQLQFI